VTCSLRKLSHQEIRAFDFQPFGLDQYHVREILRRIDDRPDGYQCLTVQRWQGPHFDWSVMGIALYRVFDSVIGINLIAVLSPELMETVAADLIDELKRTATAHQQVLTAAVSDSLHSGKITNSAFFRLHKFKAVGRRFMHGCEVWKYQWPAPKRISTLADLKAFPHGSTEEEDPLPELDRRLRESIRSSDTSYPTYVNSD